MKSITKSEILSLLKNIKDIGYNKDYLILNSIKYLEVKDDSISLNIILNLLPDAKQSLVEDTIINEIKKKYNFKTVNLNVETKVKSANKENEDRILPGIKYTIAVASGKGGVGKSTVAVNLAAALAQQGAKVGLIDADIYGPSIPIMLGINQKPEVYYEDNGKPKIVPIEKYDMKVMSIGFLVDDSTPVIWRGPMASGALKQFLTDVLWEDLDFLLFDMPPGTGDIQLTLVQTIPLSGAVIVTTPQEVSLIDARKGLKMFEKVNVPVLGLIENMSYFIAPDTGKSYDIFGCGGGEKLANELNIPYLGGIPIDPRIRIGGDKGIPIVVDMPDTEHSKKMLEIANNLTKQLNSNESGSQKMEIIL